MNKRVKDFTFKAKEEITSNPVAVSATTLVVGTGVAISIIKASLLAKVAGVGIGIITTSLLGYIVYNKLTK